MVRALRASRSLGDDRRVLHGVPGQRVVHGTIRRMNEEAWRPLGVDTEEQIAEYDALHDGVPEWMSSSFWAWVRDALSVYRCYSDRSGRVQMLDTELAERMCQTLKIPFPNLRTKNVDPAFGHQQLKSAIAILSEH
jgi:hypothetical protein